MKTDQASNTAVVVAAGLQLLQHDAVYRPILPPDVAGQGAGILRAVRPRLARMLEWRWFRAACHALEQWVMPGILLHYALRKRALQQYARQAIAQGVTQVVVLGAGFDTICARLLAEYPALCCIEVDHPATQRCKRAALGENAPAQPGLHWLALDLARQDLGQGLAACAAFDPTRPTLFIAEGLLMYLTEAQVAKLLRQLSVLTEQNWLALTWFDSRAGFARHSRWLDIWLALRNEPFLSGMARARLPQFLHDCGYVCQDVVESETQLTAAEKAALPARSEVLCGEYICYSGLNTALKTPINSCPLA